MLADLERDAVELGGDLARAAARRPEHVVLVAEVRAVGRGHRRLLGRQLDRVVERHAAGAREPRPVAASLAERDRRRILGLQPGRGGLAARREGVGLPVVEVKLGRRAHQLLGARCVLHIREADRDLVVARGLDLRLGHAELVDPVAHDVDRPVERVLRHVRGLRGRRPLVDELRAALEVESEPRRELRQDDRGRRDQPEDED